MGSASTLEPPEGRASDPDAPSREITLTGQIEFAGRSEPGALRVVAADEVIARVIPANATGADPAPPTITIGPGLRFDEPSSMLRATAGGCLRVADRRVWIDQTLHIPGQLDISIGNIDFPHGDVRIDGNVADLLKVTAGGSIQVGGAVEAAELNASGDIRIAGGILGRDKGRCAARGSIHCRFAENATISSGGDLVIAEESSHSNLASAGKLMIGADAGFKGALIAGRASAARGLSCRVLGSHAGVATFVEAGTDAELVALWASAGPRSQDLRARAKQIRDQVGPLMRNQKHLTRDQKEKATELLYKMDEYEAEAEQLMKAVRARYAKVSPHLCPEVQVAEMIYPGVTIRLRGVEGTTTRALRGPLRIVREDRAGFRAVVLVTEQGIKIALPSTIVPDPLKAIADAMQP